MAQLSPSERIYIDEVFAAEFSHYERMLMGASLAETLERAVSDSQGKAVFEAERESGVYRVGEVDTGVDDLSTGTEGR